MALYTERSARKIGDVMYAPGTKFKVVVEGLRLSGYVPTQWHGASDGWSQQLQPGDILTCTGFGPGLGSDPGFGIEFTSEESERVRAYHCSVRPESGGPWGYHPRPGTVEAASITRGVGEDDWIYCLCGNNPAFDGFAPCLRDGTVVEPTVEGPWEERLYLCLKCNRIVDQVTLDVVAQLSDFTIAYRAADDCDTCWYLIGEAAENEFGEETVRVKLRKHLESGHQLTSEQCGGLRHRSGRS